MDVGIVGLPSVGKTTLFNALTGGHADRFTDKAHLGVADIPDPRLATIAGFITTKKIIPATLHLVDLPGVPGGGDAKKLNSFLEQIRQVDAVGLVVRSFDDGTGRVDPVAEIDQMETELILADFVVAESAKDKAARTARTGDPDARARLALLEQIAAELEEGRPVRAARDRSEAERDLIRNFGFITAKPVVYVTNIGEDAIGAESPHADAVAEYARAHGAPAVAICAELEAELSELEEPDRGEMLESLGLTEPAVGPLARAGLAALGLTTFYTAGDKEVRAWTIPIGASAPEAAGVIHSDIQRGFIRAECYHVDDLVRYESEKAIREAGRLRSEGKHYAMQDGDVVHFLFNV